MNVPLFENTKALMFHGSPFSSAAILRESVDFLHLYFPDLKMGVLKMGTFIIMMALEK